MVVARHLCRQPRLAVRAGAGRLRTMGKVLRTRWSLLPLLALGLASVCSGAQAAALWRCVGQQGEIVFSSSRTGYRDCKALHDESVQTMSPARALRVPVQPAAKRSGAQSSVAQVAPAQPVVATLSPAQVTTLPRMQRNARVLRGTVYKVTLASGAVEYTNVRPVGIQARRVDALFTYLSACYACNPHSNIDWHTVPLRLHAYASEIDTAAARYRLDPALLRAVIHAESAFNPYAMSDKGAQGLMQLMPGTASDMGVRDVFNPAQNILGGARYLAQLLQDFGGNTTLATAAYNAGAAAVRKYNDAVPPYDETQLYVRRVRILKDRYDAAERGVPLAQNG